MKSGRPAVVLAALWCASLALLGVLWVRSPFTGPGPMFLLWSACTAPLLAWSWSRFRLWDVRQIPKSAAFLTALGALWTVAAVLAVSGIGAEMALDGLVMRDALLRAGGKALGWLPGAFGLALAVGGLAAALEARYRLVHGEAGPSREGAP